VSAGEIVRVLPPQISRDEAEMRFSPGVIWGTSLRAVAEVCIPFHLFRVSITDGGRRSTDEFAIDAVTGDLDLLQLDPALEATLTSRPRGRNDLEVRLDAEAAIPLLRDKVRRLIYRRGFFRLNAPTIEAVPIETLLVPYWAGFFGVDGRLGMKVIDAISGKPEGAKLRQLLGDYLADAAADRETGDSRPR
jgi:hypothetical protein